MIYEYDLHNHSKDSFDCSTDGRKLINIVKDRGMKGIGICEHDNFPDESLKDYAKNKGIQLALGIEFSCIDSHIIGYNMKLSKSDEYNLKNIFTNFYKCHRQHGKELVSQLQNKGFKISEEEILQFSNKDIVTAIDIFRYFSEVRGNYSNWYETRKDFRKKRIFEPTKKENKHFDPYEVIDLIKRSNGVAIWAHPFLTRYKRQEYFRKFNPEDVYIEVCYPYVENGIQYDVDNKRLQTIVSQEAFQRGFCFSGGSDSHYPIKKHITGEPICPGDFGLNYKNFQILNKLFN